MIIFAELRFEIYFAVQLAFHGLGFLNAHCTSWVSGQSNVVHLGFQVLELRNFSIAVGLNGCNNVRRGS